jgi:hypothetical protein
VTNGAIQEIDLNMVVWVRFISRCPKALSEYYCLKLEVFMLYKKIDIGEITFYNISEDCAKAFIDWRAEIKKPMGFAKSYDKKSTRDMTLAEQLNDRSWADKH